MGSADRLTDRQRALLATLPPLRRPRPRRSAASKARGPVQISSGHRAARATARVGGDASATSRSSRLRRRRRSRPIAAAAPGDRLLLHGVTGSGKTEVYLQAAAAALLAQAGVIVLVPEEIVLTLADRRAIRRALREDTVAVLHSKLSAGERHDEWARLRAGEARVRRPAVGGLRAGPRPRAGRRRRGARLLLQARR